MKNTIVLFVATLLIISCKVNKGLVQNNTKTSSPYIIDNYTHGDLVIKVAPFGLDGNEIEVGKVMKDGSVHLKFPELDLNNIKNNDLYMQSIKRSVGMNFCNEKQIIENTDQAKAVDTKSLFLYKNGQQVGALLLATDQKIEDNGSLNRRTSLVLGSEVSWFYCDMDANFNATCSVGVEYGDYYNFNETTTYDLRLEKGWNIVLHTLSEKEDWKSGKEKGSLPKTMSKTSIDKIPSSINWYVKYWG